MGKLYFNYSTMNAGGARPSRPPTTTRSAAWRCSYWPPRAMIEVGEVASRAASAGARRRPSTRLVGRTVRTARDEDADNTVSCVLIDEAQFLTKTQVWQLARAVDDVGVPVLCYGLRVDFRGELFPGSAALLAWADELREVRTVCFCGKKATMVVRRGATATR